MNVMEHTTAAQRDSEHEPAVAEPAPSTQGTGFAIASFVLGIASIFAGWTVIAPIVGLVLGVLSLRRQTSERTLALWGVWINVALLVFGGLLLALGLGVAALGFLGGSFLGILG